MPPRQTGKNLWVLLLIAFIASACSMRVPPPSAVASTPEQIQTDEEPSLPTPTVTLTLTPMPQTGLEMTASAIPTLAMTNVTITAVSGNLYIRRGPNIAYNPIGVLNKGDSLPVLARDILSKWVQVTTSSQAGQTGWISIQTKYSSIEGDLSKLPAIQVDDWPVAGYVINCTSHEMLVKPGDISIPSYLSYPENEVWIYPGSYSVYDAILPDTPEVMTVEMREGLEVEILVNGLGEKHKCP